MEGEGGGENVESADPEGVDTEGEEGDGVGGV